ncbi:unnamed protein product [Calicophoron daubneyi]|uniref:Uncharacterized protein n=1 Tax=Calicophoron daubneyi TaxID=300641 RepID=A0AAV2T419_CALDB
MVNQRTNSPIIEKSRVEALVCGITPVSSVVLRTINGSDLRINLCGFWDLSRDAVLPSDISKLKRIEGPFEDIANNKKFDVIFLCLPPQLQFKLLKTFWSKHSSGTGQLQTATEMDADYPHIVLVPPVSPCYSARFLQEVRNTVCIAMPLRRMRPISVLHQHLASVVHPLTLSSLRKNLSLPSHWTLGKVRSFHARLHTVSHVQSSQYSWLCESGVMGGGLLNIYGAGLIDIAFLLTGGLQLTSVSCLSRTFDVESKGYSSSIRRNSADDYMLIIGELENKTPSDSNFNEKRGPVAMFCLSSDLPPLSSSVIEDGTHQFNLSIEISGSSGQFVLPESCDRICWLPLRISNTDGKTSSRPSSQPAFSPGDLDGIGDPPILNGGLQSDPSAKLSSHLGHLGVQSGHSSPLDQQTVRIEKMGNCTEVAYLNTKNSSEEAGSNNSVQNKSLNPVQDAWLNWLSQLSMSLRQVPRKHGLDLLVATPEHWGYIQRVLIAIEKAARLRCWIDVTTGEKL